MKGQSEVSDDHEPATAYHEAGHAWVGYWHFVRKGECAGIEMEIEPTVGPQAGALGVAMHWQIRAPEFWNWAHHTARLAAGSVAEGIWGVEQGMFTWSEWETRIRSSLESERADLIEWPDDQEPGGDFAMWMQWAHEYDLPFTLDTYWDGWKEAERLIRGDWSTVEALAHALLSKRALSELEVLAICEVDPVAGERTDNRG